jgi:RHS repeat-associated protein
MEARSAFLITTNHQRSVRGPRRERHMHRLSRVMVGGRRPSRFPTLLCGLTALVLIIGLSAGGFSSPTSNGPSLNLETGGPSGSMALSASTTPLSPGELWGPSNPAEKCPGCAAVSLMSEDSAESIQPGQPVNPETGDFTTSLSLFSAPAIGGSLDMSLTYDAQRAENEVTESSNQDYEYSSPGPFGWGWQSTANATVTAANSALTFDQQDGAQVVFSSSAVAVNNGGTTQSGDGCPGGSDQDYQKYTIPSSSVALCAPGRVDAQAGTSTTLGDYQLNLAGGKETEVYNYYGQLSSVGTVADPDAVQYAYTTSSNALCAQTGDVECFIETDTSTARNVVVGETGSDYDSAATVVIDPMGHRYSVDVSQLGQLLSITDNSDPQAQTTSWGYSFGGAGALEDEMTSITNPDNDTENIGYWDDGGTNTGMVASVSEPEGGTTSYSNYENDTCGLTTSTCGTSQNVTVTYPDAQVDYDTYQASQLIENCYGATTSSNCWQFGYPLGGGQQDWLSEAVTPPLGGLAYVTTDVDGNVVQYTDPMGNTTTSMYNDNGANNLDELCWQAPPGVPVPLTSSCTDPPAGAVAYTYDTDGNQLSVTDQLGNVTRDGYYADGLLCWEAEPTVTGAGSSCGSNTSPSGAPAGATAYSYDGQGDATATTVDYSGVNAQTTSTNYDLNGDLLNSIPPDGLGEGAFGDNAYETSYLYTPRGDVSSESQPQPGASGGIETTSYLYDPDDNVVYESTPAGSTTNLYDADERLCWTYSTTSQGQEGGSSCTSPPAGATAYTYLDDTGAHQSVTDPDGTSGQGSGSHVTTYAYADPAYPTSPTTVTDALGSQVQYNAYDDYGNVCVSGPTNPGATSCSSTSGDTYSDYNVEGQLLESVNPSGITTSYAYNDPDYPTDPTQSMYGSGTGEQTYTYSYDADGDELTQHQVQGNTTVSRAYDADGRTCWQAPVLSIQPCGDPPSATSVSVYQYNGANLMDQMIDNYGTAKAVTDGYTYDPDGQLVVASDDNGRTVGYAYNDAEEVDCIAYPLPNNQSSQCSEPANPSSNLKVSRSYDAVGRLASVTDWNGNQTSYTNYNQLSELQTITYPGATSESVNYRYDPAGNLQSDTYTGSALNTAADQWSYNADNEVDSSSGLGGYSSPGDDYNDYKRVSLDSDPISGGTGSLGESYMYNNDGTISQQQPAGGSSISYSYNGADELTSINNQNQSAASADTSFAYTPSGQRCWSDAASSDVSAPCAEAPAGATSYGWNGYGELCWSGPTSATGTSCQSPPAGTTAYSYSGNGLRMTETPPTPSPALDFSWDTVDGGSTPLDIDDGTNYYIYGPLLFGGTAPVEQIPVDSTSTPQYLASNPSGVQAVFNQTGALQEQAAYTTYGTQVLQAGTTAVTPFGFQGSYTDSAPGSPTDASGLIYLIGRYYDPSTDQFMSVDPLVSVTGQPYAFTGDNPLNKTDPLGLSGNPLDVACSGGLKPPKGETQKQFCVALNSYSVSLQRKICASERGECGSDNCGKYAIDCLYPLAPLAALVCFLGGCETAGASGLADLFTTYGAALGKLLLAEGAIAGSHRILSDEHSAHPSASPAAYQLAQDLLNVLDGVDIGDGAHELFEAGHGG